MEAAATKLELRKRIGDILKSQGFLVGEKQFEMKDTERETKREIHATAKLERLADHRKFILANMELASRYMIDGEKLDVGKIKPVLREVVQGSDEAKLFRWWNVVWWSLPYERAYGRQMRYIVWDEYHNAPIGLIGLQSPILNWGVRDKYLGITKETKDFWVNQSMSAQRLGSLPPYNYVLGGKLVGSLMTSDTIRNAFKRKYENIPTRMMGRVLPAELLFITTTGAFGKSSVYTRLKHQKDEVARYIGMTHGSGTFHISNEIYEDIVGYLTSLGVDTKRGYGGGPSKKMRLINQGLQSLGIANGSDHGVKRAVYLFPFASNLQSVINDGAEPSWYSRTEEEITGFWRTRWAVPRSERNNSYLSFDKVKFIEQTLKEIG